MVSEISKDKQTIFISSRASIMAALSPFVDVKGLENLDSTPNLIMSGAARSRKPYCVSCHGMRKERYTIYAITVPICRSKPKHTKVSLCTVAIDGTHPVPLNRCPALSPLVLSFHRELRSNSSSSKSGARSPLRGRSMRRRPRRCRSIPLPVAASRLRLVWV